VRRTYEESVRELERQGWVERGQAPTAPPTRRPCFDDEALGIQFFRTSVEDADLSNLTMPGTFFGRSQIVRTRFRDTDLRNSTLCWTDFIDVDFSGACLASCDLRASTFDGCTFARADLRGAVVGSAQEIDLSEEQWQTVVASDEEPDGG
jgi:uncharacterized protein YjbI with pentapeptide repeats